MAELKDRLRADLTAAMKSQDKLRTATLRMLLAAIQTEEVAGKGPRELSDADVHQGTGQGSQEALGVGRDLHPERAR